jgi:hypothetical protein
MLTGDLDLKLYPYKYGDKPPKQGNNKDNKIQQEGYLNTRSKA